MTNTNLSVSTALGSGGPLANIGGLVSNLDTNTIVNELMAIEAAGQNALKGQQTTEQNVVSTYQSINSAVSAFQQAAQALNSPSGWLAGAATSSSLNVTATAQSSAPSGTLTFTVNQLAAAAALVSSGTAANTSTVVASSNILLSQASGLGFSRMNGGAGLATGSHTLTVTQSSSGATLTGTSVPGASTTITTGSNDMLSYTIDGAAHSAVLAAGTYSPKQLATALTNASGGLLSASLDNSGHVVVATTAEGSAHSLSINGGSALGTLGLSNGTATGTDGIVLLDGQAPVTVSDASAGASASLPGTGGSVAAVLNGGLRAGTSTLTNVAFGDGTLATVTSNINAANAGITATAVHVGPNSYRLQLNSTATGAASVLTLDPNAFTAGIGALQTLTAGADATLTVGTGPGAYQVTSPSNSVNGVMPGVTLSLTKADPNTPVTVTVAQDPTALASGVQRMIDAANNALSLINQATAYDATAKTAGPLIGDSMVQALKGKILNAVSDAVTGSSLATPFAVGIQLGSDGTITFDQAKFKSAYSANPAAVTAMFQQVGTTNGLAQRLEAVGKQATDFTTGSLTLAITGGQAETKDLAAQIAALQPMLDQRRQDLLSQFTQMESALGTLKTQSTALTNALSGLLPSK